MRKKKESEVEESIVTHLKENADNEINQLKKNAIVPFPVEVFPKKVQLIIKDTYDCLSFPIEYIGSSLLYTAGLAIGNSHKIEIKKGWNDSAVLYICLVGRPGAMKTHPISFALKPVLKLDSKAYEEYRKQLDEYDENELLNKKGESMQKEVNKKPELVKTIFSDYTPEALMKGHELNKRGVGIYVDELIGMMKNFNRYNSGSEQEMMMGAWSGTQITIDRKSTGTVSIPSPFISIIGTIQPSVLKEFKKGNRGENGFSDRFLFSYLDNAEVANWSDNELPEQTSDSWKEIVDALFSLVLEVEKDGGIDPKLLRLSPEAKTEFKKWFNYNAQLINDSEDHLAGIHTKLNQYVGRFALILQLLEEVCDGNDVCADEQIGKKAMDGAIKLTEYFRQNAVKIHKLTYKPEDSLTSEKLLVLNELPADFKTNEGVDVAVKMGMTERSFKRFLHDTNFFIKIRRGEYRTKYIRTSGTNDTMAQEV